MTVHVKRYPGKRRKKNWYSRAGPGRRGPRILSYASERFGCVRHHKYYIVSRETQRYPVTRSRSPRDRSFVRYTVGNNIYRVTYYWISVCADDTPSSRRSAGHCESHGVVVSDVKSYDISVISTRASFVFPFPIIGTKYVTSSPRRPTITDKAAGGNALVLIVVQRSVDSPKPVDLCRGKYKMHAFSSVLYPLVMIDSFYARAHDNYT